MRATPLFVLVASLTSAAPALAACGDNAYYPLKQGANWAYTVTKGDHTTQTTQTVKKVDGDKITIESAVKMDPKGNPMTFDVDGECTADGLDLNLSGGAGAAGGMTMKGHGGVFILPESKLVAGATWVQTVDMAMGSMGMSSSSKITHKVIGNEKVKVPAGEFDALKIQDDTETLMKMDGPMGAMMPKTPQTATGFSWYAKGVGLVRNENQVPGKKKGKMETQTTELTSYSK